MTWPTQRGRTPRVIDAAGLHISPGLVDGHLHQYHSYIGVNAFVEALLSHGVTATADAFYGPGIVGGLPAIRFLKEAFDKMPIRLLFLVPVLSWLQNRELGLTPTPGISPDEMLEILDWEGCYGLEEPPYLPVVEHYPEILDLFDETLARRKVITGHAAGISARQLQAFVAVGAYTDHETVTAEDAVAQGTCRNEAVHASRVRMHRRTRAHSGLHRVRCRPSKPWLLRRPRLPRKTVDRGND